MIKRLLLAISGMLASIQLALADPAPLTVAPHNYSQYVNVAFSKNQTIWQGLGHINDFYICFMPAWFWYTVMLLIPFASMYNRQGGILMVSVLYILIGGILAPFVSPNISWLAYIAILLGFSGIVYKLFVPD